MDHEHTCALVFHELVDIRFYTSYRCAITSVYHHCDQQQYTGGLLNVQWIREAVGSALPMFTNLRSDVIVRSQTVVEGPLCTAQGGARFTASEVPLLTTAARNPRRPQATWRCRSSPSVCPLDSSLIVPMTNHGCS